MKINFIGLLLVLTALSSCRLDSSVPPETTGPEPEEYRITRDSVLTGSYLDIAINDDAATVYSKIQTLQPTKGVTWLNVVSNNFSDFSLLKQRLPLYQNILLDKKQGTEMGVQIAIENQAIKSIFLNSGKELTQWPENSRVSTSIRIGDRIDGLYEKLQTIKNESSYTPMFERITLLTKNLTTSYDSGMSQSPQWYFGYKTDTDKMDIIQIHFREGMVNKINIDHYSKY